MISVIIPVYNTALLIERTIRSVLGQTVQDFEILIVDDCSTDDTLDVIRRIPDARIRIFRQEKNMGPAAARNRGLREAKGEYAAFLDGDDFWEPDFLKETEGFLRKHPEAVAVSVMQCHKVIGKEPSYAPENTGIADPVMLEDFFDFWAKFSHVCTGSVLMRTNPARKTGGQREELRICEDLEFWSMLAAQGPWGFIPKVLFTSDGGIVTRKQGWLEKNMRRWDSAPSVEDWCRRFENGFFQQTAGRKSLIGRMARILCYFHILSGKTELARQEVMEYGKDFPKTKINHIFNIASRSRILWGLLCCLLRKREYIRKV